MSDTTIDTSSLPFSLEKQKAVLGHVLYDERFFGTIISRVESEWFSEPLVSKVYDALKKWYKKWGKQATAFELIDSEWIGGKLPPQEINQIKGLMSVVKTSRETYSPTPLLAEMEVWVKTRLIQLALPKAASTFNKRDIESSVNVLNSMVKEFHEIRFMEDGESTFDKFGQDLIRENIEKTHAMTFGLVAMDRLLDPHGTGGSLLPGDMTVILAPTNVGKCMGRGTKIINSFGKIVSVEDVKVGDQLMGPDGKPRKVLSTTRGVGPLYRITPKTGGDSWVCNDVHVLSLKCSFDQEPETRKRKRYTESSGNGEACLWKGDVVNIPLDQYLKKSKDWKRRMKLWRASLDFEEKTLPIPPYILGLWLGDGHSDRAAITTMDDEIAIEWENWIREQGHSLSVYGHPSSKASSYLAIDSGQAHETLKSLGLIDNKHIPHLYLTASREQRLQVLAGLIDTDGYYGDSRYYEISQKQEGLAADIAFLARSLGFKVTVKSVEKACQTGIVGTYYIIVITGALSSIPVRLTRKAGQDGLKAADTSGFTVESEGVGEYYGFTLDGDHLYLLSDFTVTHNTSVMVTTACHNLLQGKSVLFISHEGRPDEIKSKFMRCLTGLTPPELLRAYTDPNMAEWLRAREELFRRFLVYVPLNKPGQTVEEVAAAIERYQDRRRLATGKGFDLLVNDYPAKLTTNTAKEGNLQLRHIQEIVYNQFVQIALHHKLHVLVAIQTNREGSKVNRKMGTFKNETRLLHMEDVMETWGAMTAAATVISINRTAQDAELKKLTFLVCKSRSGETGWAVVVNTDYDRCRTHSNDLGCFWYRGEDGLGERLNAMMQAHPNQAVPSEKVRWWREKI